MEKNFKQKGVASFNGLSISKSKVVTFKVKMRYDEVVTSVELLQATNTDVTIHAKVGMSKPVELGIFTVDGISFDKDRNATATFKSLVDNVNIDNISDIISEEYIQLRFLAVLELPDYEDKKQLGGE